jgi:hypothetical protein
VDISGLPCVNTRYKPPATGNAALKIKCVWHEICLQIEIISGFMENWSRWYESVSVCVYPTGVYILSWASDRVNSLLQFGIVVSVVINYSYIYLSCGGSYNSVGLAKWSEFKWDSWWTKWHWSGVFSQFFCFPPLITIPPLLHTHLSSPHDVWPS